MMVTGERDKQNAPHRTAAFGCFCGTRWGCSAPGNVECDDDGKALLLTFPLSHYIYTYIYIEQPGKLILNFFFYCKYFKFNFY